MTEQPQAAEVVVVGGGIVGTSVLYHLASAGCHDVVLLEQETLGSGSTGAAAGGIRAQFSDELNVRIAMESIARFSRFEDEVGTDIGFRQSGYLFLLQADAVPAFEASVTLQQSLGVPVRMITPQEAASMVPQLRVDDLAAATFCPIDGTADPGAAVQGYASGARRLGARVLQGTRASGVAVENDRVVGVDTPRGVIATGTVVCAAGVWSQPLAATAGVDLPVRAERRYVYLTAAGDDLPAEIPLTIDFGSLMYFHREGPGLLLGGPWATMDELAPVVLERLPGLADVPIRPGWSGDYEMSPDHNAIVGATASPAGFFYATGFSGHGFQQGPVVGRYLADLVLGRPPALDLAPFSVDRFARETRRGEVNVV